MNQQTPKQIFTSALEGKPTDRNPVAVPYVMIAHEDRWTELTGEPIWKYYDLLLHPEQQGAFYRAMAEALPFDVMQPVRMDYGGSDEFRENTEVAVVDGKYFYRNIKNGSLIPLASKLNEQDGPVNEKQIVFTNAEALEQIKIIKAETMFEQGHGSGIRACVKELGNEYFIYSAGILNVFYCCSWYVGLTNLYAMLYDNPELIEYMCKLFLEQNIERIRFLAACGGDAIYVDDAMVGNDMISLKMYEKFALPYMCQQVSEIRRLGKKAIVIYFGGIADRIEQICSIGADGLMMETSMKGYVNDYEEIAKAVNGRLCLFTNINPYDEFEIPCDRDFDVIVRRYVAKAKRHDKYVISTGSPLTPPTSMRRIRSFIDIARYA